MYTGRRRANDDVVVVAILALLIGGYVAGVVALVVVTPTRAPLANLTVFVAVVALLTATNGCK